MAVDPRAVSVLVATEEAEVHGALARYVGSRCASITCHPVRVRGLVSGSREPDYSPLAHQFVTLCRLVCGSAGVARRHASRTSSLVTALVPR